MTITTDEQITIPPITLAWSDWYPWQALLEDARGSNGIHIPNRKPGVYEVRLIGNEARLTIGKAANLRMRVRQGLVKGKTPHSSGDRIRSLEDLALLEVRWALTDFPAAVEEALHKAYVKRFGALPKYTMRT